MYIQNIFIYMNIYIYMYDMYIYNTYIYIQMCMCNMTVCICRYLYPEENIPLYKKNICIDIYRTRVCTTHEYEL